MMNVENNNDELVPQSVRSPKRTVDDNIRAVLEPARTKSCRAKEYDDKDHLQEKIKNTTRTQ